MSQLANPAAPHSLAHFAQAFLGNIFAPLAAIVTAPILASSLGVEGRGIVAAAMAPMALAMTVAVVGVPDALTHFVAKHPHFHIMLVWRATVIVCLTGVVTSFLLIAFRDVLSGGSEAISQLMIVSAVLLVPNMEVLLLRAAAMGLHKWGAVSASRVSDALLRLIAISILAATGHLTTFTATLALAMAPVLSSLVFVRGFSKGAQVETGQAPPSPTRKLTGFGLRLWIGAVSGILLSRLDQVLLTPMSTAEQLGLYVVAVNVSEVPLIVNNAVREVTFAANSAHNDDAAISLASRVSTVATTAFSVLLGATMVWWLPVFFGQEFRPAIPVALVLFAGVCLGNPGSVAGAGLSSKGYPEWRSFALVLACAVNAVLLVLLVPQYGALGAGIATLIGNVIAGNLVIYFLWRKCGVPPTSFYRFNLHDFRPILSAVRMRLKTT